MSTTAMQDVVTVSAPTAEVQALIDERQIKIEAIKAENETLASLVGKKDDASRKTRLSAGARKANRMAEIGKLELELAMEDHTVEPYVAPAVGVKSRSNGISKEELETNLAKVAKVYKTTTFETVKNTADQRIQALLKAAEKNGYKVSDPR